MVSSAEYQLKEKRRDNRKPAALQDEKSLETLRSYFIAEIKRATAKKAAMSRADYVHLRKVVLTRLTLLNARRGSEPARLLIKDFEDRNSWVEEGAAKNLGSNYLIMFVMEKGAGLVRSLFQRIVKAPFSCSSTARTELSLASALPTRLCSPTRRTQPTTSRATTRSCNYAQF